MGNLIFDYLPQEKEFFENTYPIEKFITHDKIYYLDILFGSIHHDIGLIKVKNAFRGVENFATLPPKSTLIEGNNSNIESKILLREMIFRWCKMPAVGMG